MLKQGLIRRIGDGTTKHAWDQNWLPRSTRWRPTACPRDDPPIAVSEFINFSAMSWNLLKLKEFFLPMDVDVIKSIPLSTRIQDDFWAWHFEKNGVSTIRSAYRLFVHTKSVREDWLEGLSGSSSPF